MWRHENNSLKFRLTKKKHAKARFNALENAQQTARTLTQVHAKARKNRRKRKEYINIARVKTISCENRECLRRNGRARVHVTKIRLDRIDTAWAEITWADIRYETRRCKRIAWNQKSWHASRPSFSISSHDISSGMAQNYIIWSNMAYSGTKFVSVVSAGDVYRSFSMYLSNCTPFSPNPIPPASNLLLIVF